MKIVVCVKPVSYTHLDVYKRQVYKIEPFTGDEQRTQGASWGMKSKTEFDDQAYDLSSMNKQRCV